jgi:glycosyltransferase involved in cell wall biosynthesis
MNVLYFDPKFATPRRFAPTRAYSFARHLVTQGDRVTVVGLDRRYMEPGRVAPPRGRLVDRETIDGIEVIWIGIPYAQRFSKWKRILSYGGYTLAATLAAARVPRPDVVYASSTPLTVGLNGLAYARARRVPFVFEIQDVWPDVPVALGFLKNRAEIAAAEWLERTLYRGAERVVVCSESASELLVRKGVPAEKIVLIPNLAENELFGSAQPNPGYFEELGLDGHFVALYTGAMGKANGVDQLADAARSLRARGEERVVIVALGNGSERPWLEQQAAELPNLYLPPPVARDELAGIVRAANATITLYAPHKILETGSPNKFFDSLAAGKPLVVNTDGWLRRVAEENRAGLYVRAADGDALADALLELAKDPKLADELGRNGRALAEREFDRDLLAARFRTTLEAVVSPARSHPSA